MIWLKLFSKFLTIALTVTLAQAQEFSKPPSHASSPPSFGVSDPEGFFARNPSALKRISSQILKLEQSRGYMIYLVVEPILIGTTADERAAELHHDWVPGGNGLVLVYESDSRTLGIGKDVVGNQAEAGNSSRIPSFETTAIITDALKTIDQNLAAEVYLESLVGKLAAGFESYFHRRATPPPPARSMKFGLLLAGTVALLGLGAIGVGGLMRHSSFAGVRSYHFPPVDGAERLGAPCGGAVTARRFARPASGT